MLWLSVSLWAEVPTVWQCNLTTLTQNTTVAAGSAWLILATNCCWLFQLTPSSCSSFISPYLVMASFSLLFCVSYMSVKCTCWVLFCTALGVYFTPRWIEAIAQDSAGSTLRCWAYSTKYKVSLTERNMNNPIRKSKTCIYENVIYTVL